MNRLTPPEFNSQRPSTLKLHHVILITTDTPPIVPPSHFSTPHVHDDSAKYRTKNTLLLPHSHMHHIMKVVTCLHHVHLQ